MKKTGILLDLFREIINLIIRFVKPYGIKDEILYVPQNVKHMGRRKAILGFGSTLIVLVFSFMLKVTNELIEQRMILLGIMVFMLYQGQKAFQDSYRLLETSENTKFDLIFKNEITLRGNILISKTVNKVFKKDTSNNLYKIMNNEAMFHTIKNYLDIFWKISIQHIFDILEIISILIMLVIAILTNNSVSNSLFIPLIIVFAVISFVSSAYISLKEKGYRQDDREYRNQKSAIEGDLLHVPPIVFKDVNMRIEKYKGFVSASNINTFTYFQKHNKTRLIATILETLSRYGIIIFYLIGVKWEEISLATIAEITATLLIAETALGYVSRIASELCHHNSDIIQLEKEEEDMSAILDTYHKESEKDFTSEVVDIEIKPFSISYMEESENDKPFTLTSKEPIHIHRGDVAILYGPSGSGKSTFMKMLTQRIRIEKSTEIPLTSRFLFYDETLKFGSMSIWEELFCCTKNPNLDKMQSILENLHLWDEIKSNCIDVWRWMQEKNFAFSLSNGQKQRLILAKMLYWLDSEIDALILDESTSGLDDKVDSDSADAEKILEYIVRYANSDRKRIVIISTHQNIDGFKQKLANQYTFKNFMFKKYEFFNMIKEF